MGVLQKPVRLTHAPEMLALPKMLYCAYTQTDYGKRFIHASEDAASRYISGVLLLYSFFNQI